MDRSNKYMHRRCAVVGLAVAVLGASVASAFAQELKDVRPEIVPQLGHTAAIQAFSFTPDSKIFASGDQSGIIKLWDVASGQLTRTLDTNSYLNSLVFSPDGTLVAAGNYEGITLHDTRSGERLIALQTNSKVEDVAWSHDGKMIASASDTLRLWNVASGALIHEMTVGQYGRVEHVSFSPDDTVIVSGGSGGTRLWSAATGHLLHLLTKEAGAVAFFPDGQTLVSSNGATMHLWEVTTGKQLRLSQGVKFRVAGVALASDGSTIARTSWDDDAVRVWDVRTGKLLRAIRGSYLRGIHTLALDSTGRTLALSYKDSALWNVATGKEVLLLDRGLGKGEALTFTPDGATLAVARNGVHLWNVQTLNRTGVLRSDAAVMASLRFAPDGKALFGVSHIGNNTLEAWNVSSGKQLQLPKSIAAYSRCAVVSPDGRSVAIIPWGEPVALHDMTTGKLLRKLGAFDAEVNSLAFSPDGETIAIPNGFSVRLVDVSTGHQLLTLGKHVGGVIGVAFSADGTMIGSRNHNGGAVQLWDARTGKLLRTLPAGGHWHRGLIFSPDSKMVACTGSEGVANLWNVDTGEKVASVKTGYAAVELAFSPDGKLLAGACGDGTVRFWNSASGKLLITLLIFPPSKPGIVSTDWLAYTPDSYYDGSPGTEKFIRWRVSDQLYPAEKYDKQLRRPDLVQKALQSKAGHDIGNTFEVPPRLTFPARWEVADDCGNG